MTGGTLLVRNIGRLTTWHGPVVTDAALLARAGRVVWSGRDQDIPSDVGTVPELDAGSAAVLPGFVDCHTHLVWAGSRRDDFCARLDGDGYAPGGIGSTVDATRRATYDELRALAQSRVDRAMAAMAQHCRAMLDLQAAGAVVFDYGNGLRGQAQDAGVTDAFGYPGFVVAYIRPLFSRGAGPF
ncbi:MAG TPA: hypothetical protein VKJ07_13330, partial [Mycobacteriales bacterium]|nr:hypothetical protein [Mycobacteriales bacterium]